MRVEVAYARPDRQWLIPLEVAPGASARDAVEQSGILQECPEIDAQALQLGVFGEACDPGTVLRAGDRVEIYRPLQVDPREARRARARTPGRGGRR